MGKGPKQTVTSPGRTYRGPIDTWKYAQHHLPLERCKFKSQWDITSHQSEWPSLKSQQTTSAGKVVEKIEPLVGMQTGAATVENSMGFPQKTKNGTALWPSDPTSGIIH